MPAHTLEAFLRKNAKRVNRGPTPLILRWMSLPGMTASVTIFDRKLALLLPRPGGRDKARHWFLSRDMNFANITAERFALDYLCAKNKNLEDHLRGAGPDAIWHDAAGDVGLEITTLNGFAGHWIVTERLTALLDDAGFLAGKRLKIQYDIQRLSLEAKGDIFGYVARSAQAILHCDVAAARSLDLGFKIGRGPGYIVWDDGAPASPADPGYPHIPWLKMLTEDIVQKLLAKEKQRQLAQHQRNLVIVGVNQTPMVYPFPDVFRALAGLEKDFHGHAAQVTNFWAGAFAEHSWLTGIGYYTYSIEQEEPFYPLRILWRTDTPPLTLAL